MSFKEISPNEICTYFNEKFKIDKSGNREKHYFLKEKVMTKCLDFLRTLTILDLKELTAKERTKHLSDLSDGTIELWGLMLKDALDTLDIVDQHSHKDTTKGIYRLKKYLTKFKEFEMLLYGSDKWYRDTVYHQIWFYFVGEYLFSETGLGIMDQLLDSKYIDWFCEPSKEVQNNDHVELRKRARHAFFCVIALCHDLGKPLQKIHSINNALRGMLEEYKFLHFSPFKVEFPLTYGAMLNLLIERLGQTGKPERQNDRLIIEKKVDPHYYIKMEYYTEKQPHMRAFFSTALAELNHGMLSCLLLMESFRRFKGGTPYQRWNLENGEWIQKSYMTTQSILKCIAYHGIDSIEISEIDLPYFWVCLVDDLIEGYRPTRAGKDFLSPGICKVRIKSITLKEFEVCYEFTENKDHNNSIINEDVIRFFEDKLERYYYILHIDNFKFTVNIKSKKENENSATLMRFSYEKKEGEEPIIDVEFKGGNIENKSPFNIEDFLIVEKEERVKKIQEIFQRIKLEANS